MTPYRERLDQMPIQDTRTGEVIGTYGYAIVSITVQGLINGQVSGPPRNEKALLDTGSTDSAIHPDLIGDLALRQVELGDGKLQSALAGDEKLQPVPVYHVRLTVSDIAAEWDLYAYGVTTITRIFQAGSNVAP